MPYNPSSAYPRHSTYTPPIYGREYARGFNEVSWGASLAGFPTTHQVNVGRTVQKATTPGTSEHIGLSVEAMARRGIVSNAMDLLNQRTKDRQRRSRDLATGLSRREQQDLAARMPSSNYPRPQEPPLPTYAGSRGGRKHVGGINDRLGDIAQREESSSAMDQVVEDVLTTNTAGRATVPAWRTGSPRRRGGA